MPTVEPVRSAAAAARFDQLVVPGARCCCGRGATHHPRQRRRAPVVDLRFDAVVDDSLAGLPAAARRVIEPIDVDGLSYASTAEVLDVPSAP